MKLQRLFMLGCMVLAMGLIASCSGSDGKDGIDGIDGTNGTNGTNGADGADGANGVDGVDGANGVDGVDGANGADGLACWDLDGDGIGNINHGDGEGVNEDINLDSVVDALDCAGKDGTDGADGADGNANVQRIIVDTSAIPGGTNPVDLDSATYPEIAALTAQVLDTNAVLAYAHIGGSSYIPLPGVFFVFSEYRFGINYSPGNVEIREFNGNGWTTLFDEIHIILIEDSTGLGGKSQANVMASLKAQGVDTANYQEVMEYFKSIK